MKTNTPMILALLSLALATASAAHALEVKVYSRDKMIYSNDTFVRANETAESITQRTIGQEHKITANSYGVIAIDDLKQDTSSPDRADGWCYAVDGKMPSQGFRDLKLSNKNQKLVWFFGTSAKSADGQWSECKPVFAEATTILN